MVAANFTKLSDLVIKFLISIDSYNADDLTVSDSDTQADTLGERARIVINLALSTIYGLIKDSKYLEANPSSNLSSTADQAWAQLDIIPTIDDVESVTDTTNDITLSRKSWSWYRKAVADPSSNTGTPHTYIIRNDRIYFYPTPSSAITYTIDFKKITGDLKLPGDLPLIPTQYDAFIVSEAKVKWYEMEDPTAIPPAVVSERNDIRQISLDSILTGYDRVRVSASHFDRSGGPSSRGYESPATDE